MEFTIDKLISPSMGVIEAYIHIITRDLQAFHDRADKRRYDQVVYPENVQTMHRAIATVTAAWLQRLFVQLQIKVDRLVTIERIQHELRKMMEAITTLDLLRSRSFDRMEVIMEEEEQERAEEEILKNIIDASCEPLWTWDAPDLNAVGVTEEEQRHLVERDSQWEQQREEAIGRFSEFLNANPRRLENIYQMALLQCLSANHEIRCKFNRLSTLHGAVLRCLSAMKATDESGVVQLNPRTRLIELRESRATAYLSDLVEIGTFIEAEAGKEG